MKSSSYIWAKLNQSKPEQQSETLPQFKKKWLQVGSMTYFSDRIFVYQEQDTGQRNPDHKEH